MKRQLLYLFTLLTFVACTHNDVEELAANRAELPETLTVGFETSDTRIQLDEAQKTVWNAGDLVSVFYKTLDNLKWEFQGEDGDRTGLLKKIEGSVGKQKMSEVVVVYPYNQDYILAINDRSVEAKMPAKQEYRYESYDPVCNLMIATSEARDFVLRNTCGWLKIELTGDGQQVEKLTLRGNNGETVAGDVTIDWDSSKATFISNNTTDPDDTEVGGSIVFDEASYDKLELNCHRAVLSSEPTAFYFTLPEQHFVGGITVEVKCRGYEPMVLSTDDAVEIKRNHIKPMATVEFEAEEGEGSEIPNNEIWYTATEQIWPNNVDDFGATLINNYYDDSTGEGIIEFDGELTRIPNDAFHYCYSLTSVTIPDSVTTIGVDAFGGCDSLTSVTIPDSVTTIGQRAFAYCYSLTSVTIGDSVTTIGEYAFFYCDSLTSVTIPDSVTTIGYAAFAYCYNLTSVTIPDSVTTIGVAAFYYCTNLVEFNGKFASEDGRCLIIDGTLNSFAPAGLTAYTIPDSVTTIGEEVFRDCDSLTSVTIPDSVTTIGNWAFEYCDSLTSVTIGNSVTTIGVWAFRDCNSLTSVYCKATTPPSLDSNVFDFNASDRKIYVPEEYVHHYKISAGWSDYADAIVGYDFENGVVVEPEVSINNVIHYTATAKVEANSDYPWSFDTFGANIVSNEWDSESGKGVITFDADVTTIGSDAFVDCDSLTSITIPDSVTTIGEAAFCECDSLTSVTITDSVTTIGEYAFAYCYNLTNVYCEATTPPSLGDYVFDYNASDRTIYVPDASVEAYKTAEYWSEYANAIVGYDFVNGNEEVFGKLPHEQFEVNLEVSGISATSVTVKATPNSSENRYMCRVVTKMELEAFNILDNDLEIFRYIIDNPSSKDYIFAGTTTLDWATAAEMEYLAVAFNIENYEEVYNGETEVRLFRKEFETPRGEQVDPNSLFAVSNLAVSYDNFSLDVTPLKGENSFWSYYIWPKRNYEETLQSDGYYDGPEEIVMRSYWGLNNLGVDHDYWDFGTFITEYIGQKGH